jgi:TMEM175 potassium channel family protein
VSRSRLEIFSDGVFAVAITLLALNLTIAGPGHGPITSQLMGHWQAFAAYLISFFTIGTVWVNHHALFSNIAVVTRSLLFFNLVLLLFVVLVPVATRLLAEYLTMTGTGAHLAAASYGVVLEGMSIGFALVLEWTLREGRTVPPVPPHRRKAARLRYLPGPVVYLTVIGGAFIHPLLALGLSGAIDVYYAFEQMPLRAKGWGSARPAGADDG